MGREVRLLVQVRSAKPGESQNLTALCVRSKAHWGYDAAFMKLSAAALTVSEDDIAAGRVLVAVDDADRVIGMACVLPEGDTADLDALFVDPPAIGSGAGRALFDAAVDPGPPPGRAAHDHPRRSQRRRLLRAHGRALSAARAVRRHSRPHLAVL